MIELALSPPSVLSREYPFKCKLLGSAFLFRHDNTPPTSHRIGAPARFLFTRDVEATSWMVTAAELPAAPSVGEVISEESLESYLLRSISGRVDLLRELLAVLEQYELYKTTVDIPRQALQEPLYIKASKLWASQEDVPMGPGTVMDPSVYEQDLSKAVITSTSTSPS